VSGMQRESNGGDLHARLLWFRADHPDASIVTEMVMIDPSMAVCKATLQSSESGVISGHSGASRNVDGDLFVEIAENRALLRVLTLAGYAGSEDQDVEDREEPEPPTPINLVSARTLLREEESGYEQESEAPSQPQDIRPAGQQSERSDSGDGANVNWNKFWNWARPRGYTSAKELNEMLNVENVLAFTPGEVRQMIVRYELDNPPGGQEE
jgi:hypothetical protein